MNDYISRQAAIDAIHEDADWLAEQGSDWQVERMERDKSILKSLPSAEVPVKCAGYVTVTFDEERLKECVMSMFVQCKDCEHRSGDYCHEKSMYGRFIYMDDYCSRAALASEKTEG